MGDRWVGIWLFCKPLMSGCWTRIIIGGVGDCVDEHRRPEREGLEAARRRPSGRRPQLFEGNLVFRALIRRCHISGGRRRDRQGRREHQTDSKSGAWLLAIGLSVCLTELSIPRPSARPCQCVCCTCPTRRRRRLLVLSRTRRRPSPLSLSLNRT